MTEKNQKELGLVVSQADGDSSSPPTPPPPGAAAEKRLEKKGWKKREKKVDGKQIKRIRPNGRHFRNLQVGVGVGVGVGWKMENRPNGAQKKKFGQIENSDSRSPDRETLSPKFSARTELKKHIFGQIENSDIFCNIFHYF